MKWQNRALEQRLRDLIHDMTFGAGEAPDHPTAAQQEALRAGCADVLGGTPSADFDRLVDRLWTEMRMEFEFP
jgi:hypothetical protein